MNEQCTAVLIDKGRAVVILATLRDRWDGLSPDQQAEARALLDRLAATYRAAPVATPPVRVPLVGCVTA